MKLPRIRITAMSRLASWAVVGSIVFGFVGGLGIQSTFAFPMAP